MPWFQIDDQWHLHPKVTGLIEQHPERGLAALGLWALAGSMSQAKLSDGRLTRGDLMRLTLSQKRADNLAKLLADAGLFDQEENAGYTIHDFERTHRQKGSAIKTERERRAELKRPEITEAVKARDGDHCRYCDRKVNWKDRKGAGGATYDHVDPGLVAGTSNIVVACRRCNSEKGSRTPEAAGMSLTDLDESDRIRSDPTRKSSRDLAEKDGPRARDAGARVHGQGKGQVWEGSGEGEPGLTTGYAGEVGRAGPVQPDSIIPPERRPQPTGSPFANWTGPPSTEEPTTCTTHPHQDVPCRSCARDRRSEEINP